MGFGTRMGEELYISVLAVFLILIVLYLMLNGRFVLSNTAEEMHERLDVLEDAVKMVGGIMERLPEMLPSMNLINQSPLGQILDFIRAARGETEESSLTDPLLRDVTGRFTDGEEAEEVQPE